MMACVSRQADILRIPLSLVKREHLGWYEHDL
jgi:hypothetical protein